jgi:two-component system sensor histidine kinase ChvG
VREAPQQARLLAIIQDDVVRLDRLITDISDASRVDAELSRTATERVDVVPIMAVLQEIADATRAEHEPRLLVDMPPGPLAVQAVEGRLVQVLRNLIGNARSFSPADGTISLRGRETGGVVELSVEDEGPGIPDGNLEQVFDRFYSERPSGETFGKHSGLGLSISRQIVEALGGRISAEKPPRQHRPHSRRPLRGQAAKGVRRRDAPRGSTGSPLRFGSPRLGPRPTKRAG